MGYTPHESMARLYRAAQFSAKGKAKMEILHGPCLRVLIVYYSHTGNTRVVAQMLRERTCGVLFGLEPYIPYHNETVEEESRHELESGDLPFLKYQVPSMRCYDFIMVGGPVWHGTLPPVLRTFLHNTDFAGKRVAPFCTHEVGPGSFFSELRSLVKNATLLGELDVDITRHCLIAETASAINTWLGGLAIPCLRDCAV